MAFQLDTSGCVATRVPADGCGGTVEARTRGTNLSPFTQGYVGALLCPWPTDSEEERDASAGAGPAFSDLAPATLAKIVEDCEKALDSCRYADTAEDGRRFYSHRQGGYEAAFPPLTVPLGDDGLIYLREVGQ